MPSGGSRARSGPAPDPNALRRDRSNDAGWTELPAEGRQGDVPVWPFGEPSEREAQVWGEMWRLPQAVMWESQRQHDQVALYVRRRCEVEKPDAAVSLGTLVKQLAEDLGVSLSGMHRHRWKVVEGEVSEKPKQRRSSSKAKLKVVDGG